jgi:hypothetical protein
VVCLNVSFVFKTSNIEFVFIGARNHAAEAVDMAFDMLDSIVTVTNPTNNEKIKIRIGKSLNNIK